MSELSRARPQPRNDAWIALGIAALLILAALGVWASVGTRPETAVVTRRDIVVWLPLQGVVVAPPTARADIMAPYRAPVARVYVSVGDRVKRGDVLVELALPNVQIAFEQARQELKAAQAAYEQARGKYGAAVEAAKKQLEMARAAERSARELASAPAASTEPGAPVSAPKPAPDLAAATTARIAAEQALLQAQADMETALTPYRQRVEAAQEAFRAAQAGRKMALIRSPIAGTVLTLNARPGEEIGRDPKIPVATIVDLSALQVQATMGSEEADAVKPGAPAVLTFKELPGQQFEGKVARVTTEPAGPLSGQHYVAIIEFQNDQGLVKPDMKASVSVKLGEAKNVLAVPSQAVDQDKTGRPVVEVLRVGRWQKVVVEVGLSDGRYTAIRSGLEAGATVKVTPHLL